MNEQDEALLWPRKSSQHIFIWPIFQIFDKFPVCINVGKRKGITFASLGNAISEKLRKSDIESDIHIKWHSKMSRLHQLVT